MKELKLKKIRNIEGANKLLSGGFINKLNDKFAKAALSDEDAHVALLPSDDLDQLLCWDYTRQVRNDWTIQFEKEHYQIKKTNVKVRPKQKITVRRHLDETISLWYKKERLNFKRLTHTPKKKAKKQVSYSGEKRSQMAKQNKHKTPWRHFNPGWLKPERASRKQSHVAA